MRDYELLKTLTEMGDDTWIGPTELACLLGYAERTIKQRRAEIPPPDNRAKRHLRWRLGDVREWLRTTNPRPEEPQIRSPRKQARRTSTPKDGTPALSQRNGN